MDILTAIAAIVGTIAGLYAIKEGTDKYGGMPIILGTTMVLLSVGGGLYAIYLGPKSTGDAFVDSLTTFDAGSIQQTLCIDDPSREQLAFLGSFLGIGGALLGGTSPYTIYSQGYNPFTGIYEFSYSMASFGRNTPREIEYLRFKIESEGFLDWCVTEF